MLNRKIGKNRIAPTKLSLSVAVLAALAALGSTPSWSFSIGSGNPDLVIRWDNSVRYNTGWRMRDINPAFGNDFGSDEADNTFKKHDMVTNRVDLFSEFDVVYQRTSGFRVSAAAWSENAYDQTTKQSPLILSKYPGVKLSNYGPSGEYNGFAKRYATGTSGEILDAFVFGKFELGSTSLNLKAGKHTVYWGEGLMTQVNGINHGQQPIDGIKGAGNPGAEVKELFMPLNQISAQWSLTDEVSFIAQYMLDWKPLRVPAGGTYFSGGDVPGAACSAVSTSGVCTNMLASLEPDQKRGNFGLGLRWSPTWLDGGTAGLYYRKYDEKLFWTAVQLDSSFNAATRFVYPRGTELLGVSLGKNLGPVNTGFEISYRRNTGLNSLAYLVGTQGSGSFGDNHYLSTNQTPAYSEAEGARGNTIHALFNGIWLMPQTALWDAGTMTGELSYQRLVKVTKNPLVYNSVDYACKVGYITGAAGTLSEKSGCATKDALVLNLGFSPQWTEVVPGVLLTMPTSLGYGLRGNSPTLGGNTKGTYTYSIGLTATYHTIYEFGLAYNGSHADYTTKVDPVLGVIVDQTRDPSAAQNDRGWLSFHFKTSF